MMMSSRLALSGNGDESNEFELMKTQLCLEGTASYDTVNIITVCHCTMIRYPIRPDNIIHVLVGFSTHFEVVLLN